ncbi:DUF1292 domain-containing protein [Tepidimicrobium xylanilyticum]|uniref:DUF1292 domain-containing protein n=1 Tax=Tepidimicrobium xylanilyticum TaxID=1123352 RepID=A0A1H2SI56_9FIRM|nr:DUF1292 domain-containing protein [Tepidimicrobium xylanilyticum]GMG96205.1 hypothetical protein EN5CB1_10310 [Tepidimicrobium xylanilyticum]SDW31383.1 Protein of unknown function [Tepidimicrobium xylanilyticum]
MTERITLLDEMGNKVEFQVLATFGLDDSEYAALLPVNDLKSSTYLLRIEYDDDGGIILVGIDNDEELKDVIEAYEEIQKERLQ